MQLRNVTFSGWRDAGLWNAIGWSDSNWQASKRMSRMRQSSERALESTGRAHSLNTHRDTRMFSMYTPFFPGIQAGVNPMPCADSWKRQFSTATSRTVPVPMPKRTP